MTDPFSGINIFMNKQFGVPLPKSKTASMQGPPAPNMSIAPGGGMSMVPRNDRQANGTYGVTPSSPSATVPKPTVVTPPKTNSTLPPSGNTFVQNQYYDAKTGARTAAGATAGVPDMLGGKPVTNTTENSTTGSTDTPASTDSPYIAYMKSLFDPKSLSGAYSDYQTSVDRLNGIQNSEDKVSLSGRHAAEDRMDASGGSLAGAVQGAEGITRGTNRQLADLAVREGAAARSASVFKDRYDTLIAAGKSVEDATTAASKAAQDQSNKDRDYKLNADKLAQDEKQFGMNYALEAKKVAIEQQKANQTDPNSTTANAKSASDASSSINIINQLLQNPSLDAITGSFEQLRPGFLLGEKGNLAKNQYEQIKGMLALENRGKLKGQGAVSDFEGRVLDSAASSLGRNLGLKDFQTQLRQVKGAIATSHGLTTDVLLEDPVTHESSVVNTDSTGIANAIQDGLLVTYQ